MHNKKNYIVFEVNGDKCALAVEDIIEIVELDDMVKTSADEINVIKWGNKALPVADPMAMIGFSTHTPTVRSKVLIVEKQGMKYGILVDAILRFEEIDPLRIDEPSMSEPRYVCGVAGDLKIFTPYVFLTKRMVENFKRVYEIPIQNLHEGITVSGKKSQGQARVVDTLLLSSLNWTIQASKSNLSPSLVSEAIKIHNLASKLSI